MSGDDACEMVSGVVWLVPGGGRCPLRVTIKPCEYTGEAGKWFAWTRAAEPVNATGGMFAEHPLRDQHFIPAPESCTEHWGQVTNDQA